MDNNNECVEHALGQLIKDSFTEASPQQLERMWNNISRQLDDPIDPFDPDATQPAEPITDEESTSLYLTADSVERDWEADYEPEDAINWLSGLQGVTLPEAPFVVDPFEGFAEFELGEGEEDCFRLLTSKEEAGYRNFLRLIDEAKTERPELWL